MWALWENADRTFYAKSGKFAYYVCGTLDKKGAESCPAKNHNAKKFEGAIIEQIKKRVLTRENLKELVDLTNLALDSDMKSHHNELDEISRTMNDTNQRLERIYDAIETGKIDLADLALRIKELRQRQEQLQTQRFEIENRMSDRKVELVDLKTMTEYITDMQVVLQEGTLIERKAFIRSFVKDIRVTGNDAVLTYSIPELPEEVSLEEVGVPCIVQRGGRYWT